MLNFQNYDIEEGDLSQWNAVPKLQFDWAISIHTQALRDSEYLEKWSTGLAD